MSESTFGEFPAGKLLGRYRIETVVGRGGMGVVYRAFDTALQRTVALKQLSQGADEESFRRFQRETQSAAKLNHPHVVTIWEACLLEGQPILVMEFLDKGSLQDLLDKKGPLGWAEATLATLAAAKGLHAAHVVGLIHRDLKPANLLRTSSGGIKLGDFGLVRDSQSLSATMTTFGTLQGTPQYMSPEQCRGDLVDELSDIYSLGATFYTLLTGTPPFNAQDAIQLMFAHCSMPVPDARRVNASIPACCVAIIERAMAKAPSDRFASALDMCRELRNAYALKGNIPVSTELRDQGAGDESPRPSSSPKRRHRAANTPGKAKHRHALTWTAIGAAVILLLIIAFSSSESGNSISTQNQALIELLAQDQARSRSTPPQPRPALAAARVSRQDNTAATSQSRSPRDAEAWLEQARQALQARDVQSMRKLINDSKTTGDLVGDPRSQEVISKLEVLKQSVSFRDQITSSGLSQMMNAPVSGVAFSPDGVWFAAVGSMTGNDVSLWNFAEGRRQSDRPVQPVSSLSEPGFRQVAFAPRVGEVALGHLGGSRGGVELWRTSAESQRVSQTRLPEASVRSLAYHANGRGLAVACDPKPNATGRIILLNTETGQLVGTLVSTDRFVWSLQFRPSTPGVLAIGYENGIVDLLRVSTRNVEQSISVRSESGRNWDKPLNLVFSPDGLRLAVVYGSGLYIWEVEKNRRIHHAELTCEWGDAVAWSSDGRWIAVGSGDERTGVIDLFDSEKFTLLVTLRGHTNRVLSLSFCPFDTILASGSADRTYRFWDVAEWSPTPPQAGQSRAPVP